MCRITQKLTVSMTKVCGLQPSTFFVMKIAFVGQTALHIAVLCRQYTMVKMLLAYGAKPDIQELKSGKTGLLLAIEQGNQSIADLLISYGGSISIPSWGGVTPSSICSVNRKMTDQ
jgi:ankyrin repeat protein